MTNTLNCAIEPVFLPTSTGSALYTAPAGTKSKIIKMTLNNTSAATVTGIKVYLLASGGSVGAVSELITNKVLQANENYDVYQAVMHILNAGDTIYGIAGTASAVSLRVSVVETTA